MLTEITTALSTIQTVKDLTKAVIDTKANAALREQAIESQFAIIEIQSAILSLQSQYQSLLQEKDDLKKQLIEMENWNTEAEKYSLTEIAKHVFAYALKPDSQSSTPSHWLCCRCYQDKKASVLQRQRPTIGGVPYVCTRCEAQLFVPESGHDPIPESSYGFRSY